MFRYTSGKREKNNNKATGEDREKESAQSTPFSCLHVHKQTSDPTIDGATRKLESEGDSTGLMGFGAADGRAPKPPDLTGVI
jgi:hypothetical protein